MGASGIRPIKPFLTIDDQIALLSARGMAIPSRAEADRWLRAVGYYRLSGYSYPFRTLTEDGAARGDTFVPGTTFTEVTALYEFDRHLKSLVLSGLERVEVALRGQTSYILGGHGPLAYKNPAVFRPEFCGGIGHKEWLSLAQGRVKRAAKANDAAVKHHIAHYGGEIPIWVLTDVLDFGDLSKLFQGMTTEDQRRVMEWFAITPPPVNPLHTKTRRQKDRKRWRDNPPLVNWLLHLTIVRNICAHHSRLWNRRLTPVGTPPLAGLHGFDGLPPDQFETVYGSICLVAFLLTTTSPGSTWTHKIARLIETSFAAFTLRSEQEMGFPADWRELPLWKASL